MIVAPGVVADAGLLAEIAAREFAALGTRGRLAYARDSAHLRALARQGDTVVVLTGSDEREPALTGPSVLVRAVLDRADGAPHIHGRGIEGLAWAIRHAAHRAGHPDVRRIPYGPSPEQWADLYLPDPVTSAAVPVVALVHGGYWRSIWAADTVESLCAGLAGRGLAVWNLEYRRPDLHTWATTVQDVTAGLAALHAAGHPLLDLGRVAVAGHSVGAQLALRAIADGARASLAVSLAGVLDLVQCERRWMSNGAVAAAMGPAGGDLRASSPLLRLPLGVPQLVVQGADDDLDLVDFGRRYARAASEAGDEVTYLEMPGGHFEVIAPDTPICESAIDAIAAALR